MLDAFRLLECFVAGSNEKGLIYRGVNRRTFYDIATEVRKRGRERVNYRESIIERKKENILFVTWLNGGRDQIGPRERERERQRERERERERTRGKLERVCEREENVGPVTVD